MIITYRSALLVLAAGFAQSQVTCPTRDGETVVIPAERVNDGYCDCPLTASDEPDTSACSGSSLWPGVLQEFKAGRIPITFSCPQQPNLKLPLGRVNDGVCDCCDGSDERETGVCKDNCNEVLREERRLRQEMVNKFQAGYAFRNEKVKEFETIRSEKLNEASQMETKLAVTEQAYDQRRTSLDAMELKWVTHRMEALDALVQQAVGKSHGNGPGRLPIGLEGMLATLTEEELTWWIIHACQLSGEMERDDNYSKAKTCIPLRLAGLDAGLWWEPQTYALTTVDVDDEKKTTLAKVLDYNLKNPTREIWNSNRLPRTTSTSKRRRLEDFDDYNDRDDYHDHDYPIDDEYDDEYGDMDDYPEDPDYEKDHRKDHYRKKDTYVEETELETKGDKREEILALIKSKSFSFPRVRYLAQAGNLLGLIEELTKEDKSNGDDKIPETPEEAEQANDQAADQAAAAAEEPKPEISFDPMALPMVKNQLQRRKESIERGLNFAISAKVLLDSLNSHPYEAGEHKVADLQRLAVSVLNHGKLATKNIWQLYLAVIPELGEMNTPIPDPNTCVAPWASSCPPKSIERTLVQDGSIVKYSLPPAVITEEATSHCNNLKSDQSIATGALCASDTAVPSSNIADGYFGYFRVFPRPQDDLMAKMFVGLESEDTASGRTVILEYEAEIENLQREKDDLKRKISETIESVGGTGSSESMLGPSGELFYLKNQCISYEAAKYTYELCLFKSAKQKDSGNPSGTHLGDWSGASIDEETGDRLWNWSKGTRCWNGPQRSATAIVTCGSETRVLSADEPETCRYVFEVESPVACDDKFRTRNNL